MGGGGRAAEDKSIMDLHYDSCGTIRQHPTMPLLTGKSPLLCRQSRCVLAPVSRWGDRAGTLRLAHTQWLIDAQYFGIPQQIYSNQPRC